MIDPFSIFATSAAAAFVGQILFAPSDTNSQQSNDPQTVFTKVAKQYGTQYAQTLEKLYRYETGHFRSGQYVKTFSPGMRAFSDSFPFGWSSLQRFTTEFPQYAGDYAPVLIPSVNLKYVKFPSLEAAVMFTAWFIKNIRGGDFGRWNSNDPATAAAYLQQLQRVSTQYT